MFLSIQWKLDNAAAAAPETSLAMHKHDEFPLFPSLRFANPHIAASIELNEKFSQNFSSSLQLGEYLNSFTQASFHLLN